MIKVIKAILLITDGYDLLQLQVDLPYPFADYTGKPGKTFLELKLPHLTGSDYCTKNLPDVSLNIKDIR